MAATYDKGKIPWRSVMATDKSGFLKDKIKDKYNVPGVPYCLFVHPGGFMEAVDVRKVTELDRLYKTLQIDIN